MEKGLSHKQFAGGSIPPMATNFQDDAMPRVIVPKHVLDRFNEDHFDQITEAAFTFDKGTVVTDELLLEQLLLARQVSTKENNPPTTGRSKRSL